MRVEIGEHAADGVRAQFFVLDGLNVTLLYRIEDFGEGAQFLDRQAGPRFLLGQGGDLQADADAAEHPGAKPTGLFQLTHQFDSSTMSFKADPSERVERLAIVTQFKV